MARTASRRRTSRFAQLFGTLVGSLWLAACEEGTALPPDPQETPDDGKDTGSDAGDSGTARPDVVPEAEQPLAPEADGSYGPDALGLVGKWASSAGPDSSVELRFEGGQLCMSGQTGTVQDSDYATYFGARATFNLCEDADGIARPVSECLGERALDDLVGVGFSLTGDPLPWLVGVEFNEANRESPARLFIQEAGDTIALLERVTDPLDSSAPTVTPSQLLSVSVRAAGTPDGPQSFDFCFTNFRLLFGEEWTEAVIPSWLSEAGPGRQNAYVGVNLVGAEFGESQLPGTLGSDYIYPNASDVDYYSTKGMNIFRVPFRWERLQQELYAELDEDELAQLSDTIALAKEHNAIVILDPHNFARYEDDTSDDVEPKLIGSEIEIDAFSDFWSKLALKFANDEAVWFGLMNEPHDMETETWLAAANGAIAAIREAGAENRVLVPGNQWTGAHSWFADYYGTPNAEAMRNVEDPAHNFAFELHQYFDQDSSGTATSCVSESIGVERVQEVTTWLRENEFLGFLGEFGGSDDPICLGASDQLLTHLGENSDAWLGWTVWASSEWGIQHNVRPVGASDSLQMQVLLRHLDTP